MLDRRENERQQDIQSFLSGLEQDAKSTNSPISQPLESTTAKEVSRRAAMGVGAGGVGLAIYIGLRIVKAIARANQNNRP